jgi:hypothetical protein
VPDSLIHFERYWKLIERSKGRPKKKQEGYHLHHVVPKCMKGSNEEYNLVLLTYREHYLAHCLLSLAFPKDWKLANAVASMKKEAKNSRLYSTLVKRCGKPHTEETKAKIGDAIRGKKRKKPNLTKERREQLAEQCRERGKTEEHRRKSRESALRTPTWERNLAIANRPERDRTGVRNSKANKEVWEKEEWIRKVWEANGKPGIRKLFRLVNIGNGPQSLKTLVKKFRDDDIV